MVSKYWSFKETRKENIYCRIVWYFKSQGTSSNLDRWKSRSRYYEISGWITVNSEPSFISPVLDDDAGQRKRFLMECSFVKLNRSIVGAVALPNSHTYSLINRQPRWMLPLLSLITLYLFVCHCWRQLFLWILITAKWLDVNWNLKQRGN